MKENKLYKEKRVYDTGEEDLVKPFNECPRCKVITRDTKGNKNSKFLCNKCHKEMLGIKDLEKSHLEEKKSWEVMLERYKEFIEELRVEEAKKE